MQQDLVSLAGILVSFSIFVGIIANLMGDIIGFSLIDIIKHGWTKDVKRSVRFERYFPFEILSEPELVLPSLLPGHGLLSDLSLPYQRRIQNRNITEELRNELFINRKLLVSGIAGIGKTRETGKLLADLVDEGFTVLRAMSDAQFDLKIIFPDQIRNRLVLLFDDLHQYCSETFEEVPQNSAAKNFLNNLMLFIERAEAKYSNFEVYIIFIARTDTYSWNTLLFPQHPIWNNVKRYELPIPDLTSQQSFIVKVSEKLDINVSDQEALQIARSNDGTFRNLAQNIFRAKRSGIIPNVSDFTSRQGLTWLARYEFITENYPKQGPIFFDTIKFLTDIGIQLNVDLILSLCSILTSSPVLASAGQVIWRRRYLIFLQQLQDYGDLMIQWETRIITIPEMLLIEHEVSSALQPVVNILTRSVRKYCDLSQWLALAKYYTDSIELHLHAIRICTEILRQIPTNFDAWYIRARALMALGQMNYALLDADEADKLDEGNPEILNFRGALLIMLGKRELAKQCFDRAVFLEENNDIPLMNRAGLYMMQKDYMSALGDINKAIEFGTNNNIEQYLIRAQIYIQLKRFSQAEQDIEFIMSEVPDYPVAYSILADMYIARGQDDMAEDSLNKLLSQSPRSSSAYLQKAAIFERKKDYENAKVYLDEAIRYSSNKGRYYFSRSQLHIKMKKHTKALKDIDNAIRIDGPKFIYVRFRALILNGMGLTWLAKRDALTALSISSKETSDKASLAELYRLTDQDAMALESLDERLTLGDDDATTYHQKAHSYASQRSPNLALQCFDKAIELEPSEAEHYICRGTQYLHTKSYRNAVRDFATALDIETLSANAYIGYIDSLNALGQLNRARLKYQKLSNQVLMYALLAYIDAVNNEYNKAFLHISTGRSLIF